MASLNDVAMRCHLFHQNFQTLGGRMTQGERCQHATAPQCTYVCSLHGGQQEAGRTPMLCNSILQAQPSMVGV